MLRLCVRSYLLFTALALACGTGGGGAASGGGGGQPIGGGGRSGAVASISLTQTPSGPLTSLGETRQLTAVPRDASGTALQGISIAFSSSNTAVATVSQSGLVTAVANGTTTIHASAGGKEALLDMTVQVVTSVSVSPATTSIPRCTTTQYTAVAKDAGGNTVANAPLTWQSSSTGVATVDANGLAKSVAAGGPVNITARTPGGVSGTAQLTVTSAVASAPIVVNWNLGARTTPVNVAICAGQSVVWRNTDSNAVHTATRSPPPPATDYIQPGMDSTPQPFTTPATYTYNCLVHPDMTGTVTVTP